MEDLARIAEVRAQVIEVNQRLYAAVEVARSCGRTWAEIGQALGVSKQAARERFGKEG